MPFVRKRVRLSVVAKRTQTMLLYLLLGVVVFLGAVYLFFLNHVAFRGIVLQKEAQKNMELLTEMSHIDSKIASIQTREKLEKVLETRPMIERGRSEFMILTPNFTAKEGDSF